ncbi:hypothetical protein G6F66_014294 [Rhizopus arrhizus]|nr:hypothetical protein G6F66_014294 [Rhizopus arrhizus]
MVRDREQYNSLSPVYKGPYRIVRQVQGGAYILRDVDETLMSRNYSPEELKIISQDEVIPKDELYEIEAIINHRGEPGNREYSAPQNPSSHAIPHLKATVAGYLDNV